jgi:hypothetical protein
MDVQVIRLDDWLNENNISKEQIALIKLDVEGWEKFVLNGASGFLREQSPVLMIEFDENNAWAAGYLCHDLYDNLSDRGYKLYALNNGKLQSEPKRLHYPSQNLFAVKDDSSFYKRLSLNAIL